MEYTVSYSTTSVYNDKKNNDTLIQKKKKLLDIVHNLSKLEYMEIFQIFSEDGCQYSENSNGVFINLNNVSEPTIDKIYHFINFIKHKKEDLLIQEEKVNLVKETIKDNNEKETEYLQNEMNINMNVYNNYYDLDTDDESDMENNQYLNLSSDEEEDIENKISLKKKRTKYTGKKAKIIKSYRENNETSVSGKTKPKSKKDDSE